MLQPLLYFRTPLYFVQLQCSVVDKDGAVASVFSISDADMATAVQYATLAADPISRYCNLYGKNSIAVHQDVIKFSKTVPMVSYYDQNGRLEFDTLVTWVEEIVSDNHLPPGACVVVLNPSGLENTYATQVNAVGYHATTAKGPYIWCATWNKDWTVDDQPSNYAWFLSHEIAEMVVSAGGGPEVCDPCTALCGNNFVSYFDSNGMYIVTVSFAGFHPPKPAFDYLFYVSAIAVPGFAVAPGTECPSDQNQACNYGLPAILRTKPTERRREMDAAWLVRLWLMIHGPDPAPEALIAPEILSEDSGQLSTLRAIAGLARCLNDASAEKAILAALQPLSDRIGAKPTLSRR